MELQNGMEFSAIVVVNENNTAKAVGSGSLAVFATPMMIALMEQAAAGCVQPALPQGQSTVGTEISVTHTAPTAVGKTVTATAKLVEVDRRRLVFEVKAEVDGEIIGQGTHQRFVIEEEKFMSRL